MKYLYVAAALTIGALALSVPACGSDDAALDGGAGGGGGGDTGGGGGGVLDLEGGEEEIGTAVQAIAVKAQAVMSACVTTGGTNVLDVAAGVAENSAAVHDAMAAAAGNASCVNLIYTPGSAKITADFTSQCPFSASGIKITGRLEVMVAVDAGAVTVTFNFINLAIDGYPNLTATGSITTSGGGAYTFAVDVISPVVFALSGTVVSSGGTVIVSGIGSYTKDGKEWALTLTGVTWKSGDCYPSSGTVSMKTGPITETLTFTDETAATGKATISVGKASADVTLKPYGSCP